MRRDRKQKDIARELGFCDEFHFSKVFRRNMGVSPQAFRLKTLGTRDKQRA
jgi:AraC-like DNA-binding protein